MKKIVLLFLVMLLSVSVAFAKDSLIELDSFA